eukprot:1152461-Pelagomonas_calceolata.AAC.2
MHAARPGLRSLFFFILAPEPSPDLHLLSGSAPSGPESKQGSGLRGPPSLPNVSSTLTQPVNQLTLLLLQWCKLNHCYVPEGKFDKMRGVIGRAVLAMYDCADEIRCEIMSVEGVGELIKGHGMSGPDFAAKQGWRRAWICQVP